VSASAWRFRAAPALLWLSFLSTLLVHGVANAGTPLPELAGVRILPTPRAIADFELTDQDGRPFRISGLRGTPVLVFFGFTHCSDVCPLALQRMQLLRKSYGPDLRRVRLLMISVDGQRDTPAQLKSYLAPFQGDPMGVTGLTGDPEDVRRIAGEFSAVFFKSNPTGPAGDYRVPHSVQFFAVDGAGQLRAEIYDATLDAMVSVIKALD
jgi:protein SCO1/2